MNTTTATAPTTWTTSRDRYGRTQYSASRGGRILGVAVRLPKGAEATFLSNDWGTRGGSAVRFHATLAQAKARIEAL